MVYASMMSTRELCRGPPGWKRLRSGNAVPASRRMDSNQSFIMLFSDEVLFCISLARCRALLYVSSVKASSLPIARCQTGPRNLGGMPRHQSSLVRCSEVMRSQSGQTYCSQMRCNAEFVESRLDSASAAAATFRFSKDALATNGMVLRAKVTCQLPKPLPSSSDIPSNAASPLSCLLAATSSVSSWSRPSPFLC